MNPDIPAIDNCCTKEVYAFFGLAAYLSQVLEHSALNLAIVLKFHLASDITQEIFDEIYNNLSKKTFGHLLNSSKKSISISEEDLKYLNEALELRNILMHHYFRIHAENFVSEVGRLEQKRETEMHNKALKAFAARSGTVKTSSASYCRAGSSCHLARRHESNEK